MRDLVCLNAAAALVVAGLADDLADGFEIASAAIDDGNARSSLDRLVACRAQPPRLPRLELRRPRVGVPQQGFGFQGSGRSFGLSKTTWLWGTVVAVSFDEVAP